MEYEVYKITVTHYMQFENGDKINLEDPIVCQQILPYGNYGGSSIILNEMFDRLKTFALERAKK